MFMFSRLLAIVSGTCRAAPKNAIFDIMEDFKSGELKLMKMKYLTVFVRLK